VLWRLLGPLEVRAGSGWTRVDGAKPRALAAALLAQPGRVVSTARLVGELWGDDPPPTARKLVSGYVLRLRRLAGDPEGRSLVTRAPGYLLTPAAAAADASRFEELLAEGRRALDDDAGRATRILSEALALWRGPALADVPRGAMAAAEADRLEELRLAAVELRIDADARCGRAAELVPELRLLTTAYPLRERFWDQLMRALERCGRPAEALAAYAQARAVIADELGADPGPGLRRLHERILAGAPASAEILGPAAQELAAAKPLDPPGSAESLAPPAIPRQLPSPVPHFVGRETELRQLSAVLDQSGAATTVWVIGGTPGVGKTALAVHWAHEISCRFPDGQLYADLRGYDPEQPLTAADALAGFLRALGVADADIPPGADERAALYRSLLAGRRVLVLLDNAGEGEQVRPLLPGGPPCVTVVTSRDTLAGLVVREGARRLDLGLLSQAHAAGLLRALIGARAAADPGAAAALAELCARLPLALRLAAELAASRGGVRLADLVAELNGGPRLDLLDANGDPRTAVRTVFSWSYRHLDAATARMFRLAGLHPGAELDGYAAAALAGTTLKQAAGSLDRLARAHLIDTRQPGRYGLHDLLCAYARELAAEEGQDEARAALTRLLDYYLCATAEAVGTLYAGERPSGPGSTTPTPIPSVTGRPDAARAWLDTQRATLGAVVAHAARHGWPGHAVALAAALFRYLEGSGHCVEAVAIHGQACHAARLTGDHIAEAGALTSLGLAHARQGRYQRAAGQLQEALDLFRKTGDLTGQTRALGNLGIVRLQQGRYREAEHHYRQVLSLIRELGDQRNAPTVLTSLGNIALRQGRYRQAAEHLQQALALYRKAGDRNFEAYALQILGLVDLRQGRYAQAIGHSREALTLARQTGNRACEAYVLANLGAIELHQGRYQQAASSQQQALAMFREIGDRSGQAHARNGLGGVFLATGEGDQARSEHAAALALADRIGDKYEQAFAHDGLGRAHHALGDQRQTARHWRRALTLFAELGAPEAAPVRARLASLGRQRQDRLPQRVSHP
jgi:DNA-binding SARP family transcriptional activator/tetratricopeptide (TPR) repeat protein